MLRYKDLPVGAYYSHPTYGIIDLTCIWRKDTQSNNRCMDPKRNWDFFTREEEEVILVSVEQLEALGVSLITIPECSVI